MPLVPGPGRESETYVRFLDQVGREAALAALGAEQHGVFALAQLRALGLAPRMIQQRATAERLHRVHRGVYSLAPPQLLGREGRWLAAVLACGPDAVVSHRTAAALHELRATSATKVDVTVAGRSARRHDGIRTHRASRLTPADTTRVLGLPCTTVARTLLDLAAVIDRRGLERAFDQAEILSALNIARLEDQLARNTKHPGAPAVRAVLEEHHVGATPTWSELEERFLALCRSAAVVQPEVNAWVDPQDGEPLIRVDFVWRAQRLAVETDGRATHRTRQAFERDRRNDQRLTTAGWRPVRITWRQITGDRQRLEATIRALLRA